MNESTVDESMTLLVSNSPGQSHRTGLLVMFSDGEPALCPFFAKCDGVLFMDPVEGRREFCPNTGHSVEAICDVILRSGVQRLVLGFVSEPAAAKLHAAGIDIRLGSCACALDELVDRFDELPAAPPRRAEGEPKGKP